MMIGMGLIIGAMRVGINLPGLPEEIIIAENFTGASFDPDMSSFSENSVWPHTTTGTIVIDAALTSPHPGQSDGALLFTRGPGPEYAEPGILIPILHPTREYEINVRCNKDNTTGTLDDTTRIVAWLDASGGVISTVISTVMNQAVDVDASHTFTGFPPSNAAFYRFMLTARLSRCRIAIHSVSVKILAQGIAILLFAWSITPTDGGATVVSSRPLTGEWSITPGDGEATVNTFPEVA